MCVSVTFEREARSGAATGQDGYDIIAHARVGGRLEGSKRHKAQHDTPRSWYAVRAQLLPPPPERQT